MSFSERFASDGWMQIDGIFDRGLIDDLCAEYRRQYDALLAPKGDHRGYIRVGDKRMMLSVRLQGPFLDPRLYANPLLLPLLQILLGEDFLIDSFACVTALPGAGDQAVHTDFPDLFPAQPELRSLLGPYAITVAVPLIDLTPDTGTTRIYPPAHDAERSHASVLPCTQRGGCFLMDYRLSHHGTANASGEQRPILYIVYARPWFTDTRNFRRQPRINIDRDKLSEIPAQHHPLFRRLAAKGAIDMSEKELFP